MEPEKFEEHIDEPQKLEVKLIQSMEDFIRILGADEPIKGTRVKREETPDGPMHTSETVIIRTQHCFHDSKMMMQRGNDLHGSEICCFCGFERKWHTEQMAAPGHGKFFTPVKVFRVYDEEEIPLCQVSQEKE